MVGRPRLGQHFLRDPRAARRIAALVPSGVPVVEIGPGRGALTALLLDKASAYTGVELDGELARKLTERLAERFGDRPHCAVVEGDFLDYEPPPGPLWLVGNIPYAVSSKIVQRVTGERRYVAAVLMFQREFAARLTARPGDSAYGSLSAYVAYHWEAGTVFKVGAGSFSPKPRVDSAVVVFRRRESPPVEVDDEEAFFKLVRAAFARRRKQLGNAGVEGLGMTRTEWLEVLERADIGRGRRAQELSLEDFARLYEKSREVGGGTG
jgi:16S rRNA (adenine1518-N6/adenine1519-N6)-dimethyltransferase